jgi:hypothetical protein
MTMIWMASESNIGEHGKLCNFIHSVCIRDVDVF